MGNVRRLSLLQNKLLRKETEGLDPKRDPGPQHKSEAVKPPCYKRLDDLHGRGCGPS